MTSTLFLAAIPSLIRWDSPRALPPALAAGALLSAAVIWFYPSQVRGVRRPLRWFMPALRMAALWLIVLAIARPVAIRREPAGERGTIIFLLDRSASMDVVDIGREKHDLVAIADSMGLLPPGARGSAALTQPSTAGQRSNGEKPAIQASAARPQQLGDALDDLNIAVTIAQRAQSDLDYARVSGQGVDAAQARVTAAGRRYFESSQQLSRLAMAAFPSGGNPLRDKLKAMGLLFRPDTRGLWLREAQRRITSATEALALYQREADQQLFETNSDVRTACEKIQSQTRFDLAKAAIFIPGTGLIDQLARKTSARIAGFAFASDVKSLGLLHAIKPDSATVPDATLETVDDPALMESGTANLPIPPLNVRPDGTGTDLLGAVNAAVSRVGISSVRAVVVFTDGRDVLPPASKTPAPPEGVAVYAVAAAPDAPCRDISFAGVTLPRGDSAFAGENTPVLASLNAVGMTANPADIRLRIDGSETLLEPRRVREKTATAEFLIKLDQPGERELEFSIAPAKGEATDRNNRETQWLKVLPDKIRVSAYSGSGNWDFQFLRSALSQAGYIQLNAGVLSLDHPSLPLTPKQILQQDVLLLDDVPASALSNDQWDAVCNKLVRERGGSVILVAGASDAISSYSGQVSASALLPYDPLQAHPVWSVWPGEQPRFRILPPHESESAGLNDFAAAMRLESADAGNHRWLELPALFRIFPLHELRSNARPLLIESDKGECVMAEARPGLGRSILVGTDETWRWRRSISTGLGTGASPREKFQDAFWVQLVRYAAEEPYAAREGAIALDVTPISASPGQPISIRARLYEQSLQTAAEADPNRMRVQFVETTGGHRVVRTLPLAPSSTGGGRWTGTLSDLQRGDYEVRLTPPADADSPPLSVGLHVTDNTDAELKNVSGDYARLHKLAESTHGDVLRMDQLQRLPNLLADVGDARPSITELPLWDSPLLFILIVACFAAEWGLRKRFGMA